MMEERKTTTMKKENGRDEKKTRPEDRTIVEIDLEGVVQPRILTNALRTLLRTRSLEVQGNK